jgi:predicted membrane protein
MKMKKVTFDVIFIILSALVLMLLSEYHLLEEYIGFALIPVLLAYYLGQYSQRQFSEPK